MVSNDELKGVVESVKNTCIQMATGGEFSYEKYEAERDKALSYPELAVLLPAWLIRCRYGQQYWHFISGKYGKYAERRIFLRGEFDNVTDQLEMSSNRPFVFRLESQLTDLNHDMISTVWRKIIQRSQNDPEGAITACRSMVETVMKAILDSESVEYTNKDDFNTLYTKVRQVLALDPATNDTDSFKQIYSGVISVINGVGRMRNAYGDAHGKDVEGFMPAQHHTELMINLTGALCCFLVDAQKTKINT